MVAGMDRKQECLDLDRECLDLDPDPQQPQVTGSPGAAASTMKRENRNAETSGVRMKLEAPDAEASGMSVKREVPEAEASETAQPVTNKQKQKDQNDEVPEHELFDEHELFGDSSDQDSSDGDGHISTGADDDFLRAQDSSDGHGHTPIGADEDFLRVLRLLHAFHNDRNARARRGTRRRFGRGSGHGGYSSEPSISIDSPVIHIGFNNCFNNSTFDNLICACRFRKFEFLPF